VVAEPLLGIVGGVGPYAALDLAKKICDETVASRDQDHLPMALLSLAHLIPDRTAFLLGETEINPALAIVEVVSELENLGCRVIGVPCNTAHAAAIWDVITEGVAKRTPGVTLVNMVEEVAVFVRQRWSDATRVGVLSTVGTQLSRVYPTVLARHGLEAVTLQDEEHRVLVHDAVYDPEFGVKAHASPVSERARRNVLRAVEKAAEAGAQIVVLGCTELPLAVPEPVVGGTPVVDATRVLARAMVRSAAPERLRG
jgi:aspartate racemase